MMRPARVVIADPIHGSIELGPVERQIIETPIFQRLRNVKQLGLAHLIYPGADYSRFSHSVGASYLAGQITDHLNSSGIMDLSSDQRLFYRVAALLHDVGHYPFSHAAEEAIETYYEAQDVPYFDHEECGETIVLNDVELQKVLNASKIDIPALWRLASGKVPGDEKLPLANLISADLDVDRMDYLQRTARHTGLPYGNFDERYLILQSRVDSTDRLAINYSALGTVEHLLMGRFYDYLQVSFHKTVQAFEWLLKDVIKALLEQKKFCLAADTIKAKVKSGDWCNFDDFYVYEHIKQFVLNSEDKNSPAYRKASALILRQPPTMIAEYAWFTRRENSDEVADIKNNIGKSVKNWAGDFKIDETYWKVWSPKLLITKNGPPKISIAKSASADVNEGSLAQSDFEKEAILQEQAPAELKAPRILMTPDSNEAIPIFDCYSSIMQSLSNYQHFILRVYVLLSDEQKEQNLAEKIRKRLLQDYPSYQWKYG